ncbi:MAG: electron transfer flavoprotein subunit beta [Bacteroidetes bacterium]|nr:electron transfer flavoprotein subunit beta [Bacteroidota bacterium]
MNILVILKHVPDLVEELEINAEGTDLDRSWMRYIPSEYDEHALEQAILLKEEHGGTVTALTLQIGEVEDTLFTASAKGADRLVRIEGDFEGISSRNAAAVYADHVRRNSYDLILTGVQAYDDLEGPVGARLAAMLALPYVGVVSGLHVDPTAGVVHLHKEYPGGMLTVIRTELPAVVGIQSAMKPPRYVPIAKIRQASKSAAIEEADAPADALQPAPYNIRRVSKPQSGGRAEMIEGSTDDIAVRLLEIFTEHGLVR